MKTVFLFIGVLAAFAFAAPLNCSKFRTGTFTYKDDTNGTTISRNDTEQVEKSQHPAYFEKYRVLWKNDCQYDLILKETDMSPDKMPFKKGDTLHVTITAVFTGRYQFSTSFRDRVSNGTLIKL